MRHTRFIMVALVAAITLSLAASQASALRSIETGGVTRRVTASGRLRFGNENLEASMEILCNVTLLRTIAGAIQKRSGAIFGGLTGVAIDDGLNHCGHGSAITNVLAVVALKNDGTRECTELGSGVHLCVVNWNLLYNSILGTLPEITGVNFTVERVKFLIRFNDALGFNDGCLYEGNVPAFARVSAGSIRTGEIILERRMLTLIRRLEGFACPNPATLSGTFALEPAINIRLT
ncbi:MAG TPA: hypothetical protein VE972_10320 [Conexibacter sp.]|nr:hypothetical protein [Conexibacter sp.]